MSSPRFDDAQFLTIDLDVRSRRSLGSLAAAWPRAYLPTHDEGRPNPHWLILHAWRSTTAEGAARELLQHIGRLRGDALRCWKHAHRRTFDVGVQAGSPGRPFEGVQFTARTLARIAAVGGQIQVTVYAPLAANQPQK